MSNAYDRVTWRGFTFDNMTVQAIEQAEKVNGGTFTIDQGSYNPGGVSASAGTHDGGGAVDVAATSDPAKIVRALRTVGFAAWHRLPSQGPWGEHVHAVLIGNAKLSPAAAQQVVAYKNGRDGLADNAPDPTWRPSPIPTYTYRIGGVVPLPPTKVTQARALLREALATAGPIRKAAIRAGLAVLPKR